MKKEILKIINSNVPAAVLVDMLHEYHEKDIAQVLEYLTQEQLINLCESLGDEIFSEIIAFVDKPEKYIHILGLKRTADLINEMDSDDAVDFLESVDESLMAELRPLIKDDIRANILLINSYSRDEIGSLITTNYIKIDENLTIKQATSEVIKQAGTNDNISILYVVDKNNKFSGAIDLKDLIIARKDASLEELIVHSFPYFLGHDKISEHIENLKDYAEDSLPVLNENHEIIGILTAQDIVEIVDDEMGDDYAKLAGLTAEEDLHETTKQSMKKRLPWLIALLFLGMVVSTVVGAFESVVAVLPIVICFQSLILDMAGNVGTQSLAVTIRVLMDENLTGHNKISLIIKELKVGFSNGILLGIMSLGVLGVYVHFFKGYQWVSAFLVAGCVGVALVLAMVISSLVGTLVPLFFNKIKIDPAVASGPLITTINDLVAVVTYYGLAWLLLIEIFKIV